MDKRLYLDHSLFFGAQILQLRHLSFRSSVIQHFRTDLKYSINAGEKLDLHSIIVGVLIYKYDKFRFIFKFKDQLNFEFN